MANPIVTVNVFQQVGPTPNNLQRTGALLSQGGTNTAPGTSSLLTELSDLTPIISGAKALTSLTQSAGLATATATAAHGLAVNDTIYITIAGATPAGYNGTFLCTITSTTAFTYAVPSSLAGSATGTLVYTLEDVGELLAMATTFFAQGNSVAVYVLELGPGNPTEGVAYLSAWITTNPAVYYSYLVPRTWDNNAAFIALFLRFEANTSKTYFWVTTTLATWRNYTVAMKCVNALIEAPQYGKWQPNALTAISYTGAYGANALTAISWASTAGGTVTATTTTAHGVVPGNLFTISGVTPAGYNGTFVAIAGTTGSTLKYALADNPGSETVLGTLVASTFGSVTATTTTAHGVVVGDYFSIAGVTPTGYNGTFQAILGTTGSTLVYALAADPGSETILGTLVGSGYTSAGVAPLEFSQAAPYWRSLSFNPSSTNKVPPFGRGFVTGVTPFPTSGNGALLTALKAANISVIGTGAEGGISNTLCLWGNFLDGRPFNYWYSVDYAQINLAENVANAVINGSNTPTNPLYNNQAGITALEGVIANTMTTMITVGLALGNVVQTALNGPDYQAAIAAGQFLGKAACNAVPFADYYKINPGQYALGQYDGFAVIYAPLRGFDHITINLTVTDFVAG